MGTSAARRSSSTSAAGSRQEEVQGRADRRPLRRLRPGAAPRHPGGLRGHRQGRAPSWARAASSSWTRTPAWWTWPASSWTSSRTSPAASAPPAARARGSMLEILDEDLRGARRARRHRDPRGAVRHHQGGLALRAGPDRRPTRCSPRCATSGTSTRRTSTRSAARRKRCVALLKFEVDPEICTKCGACFTRLPGRGHHLEEEGSRPASTAKSASSA